MPNLPRHSYSLHTPVPPNLPHRSPIPSNLNRSLSVHSNHPSVHRQAPAFPTFIPNARVPPPDPALPPAHVPAQPYMYVPDHNHHQRQEFLYQQWLANQNQQRPTIQAPPLPVPPPPNNTITTSFAKSDLPSLLTIPFLRTSTDWVTWESAATRLIDNVGLRGHICRLPELGALIDPTSPASLPPHYDFDSSPKDVEAYKLWWHDNDIVTHILVGHLSPEIAISLPPKHGPPYNLPIRTSRDVLEFLTKKFSVGSAGAADLAKENLFCVKCNPSNIAAYVQAWRGVVHQLADTPWDFTPYQKIQKFVDGLPSFDGFIGLKDRVRVSWAVGPTGTYESRIIAYFERERHRH